MTDLPPSPTAAQLADPAWCEAQYNPRLTIPDPAGKLKEWADLAAATRARLPFRTISYGAHPREAFDLFPAENPKGLFAFIHGGYWRAQHKDDFSWVADALVPAGHSVAVITYPLCPEVTVSEIARCCQRAVVALWRAASPDERANFVLSGHSAGGYLTAVMLCVDWSDPARWNPPGASESAMETPMLTRGEAPFRRGISWSGVFELTPLLNTSVNELVRLSPDQAEAWSMHNRKPNAHVPFLLAYGAQEPGEFHRQSIQQAKRWRAISVPAIAIENANHFSIVEQLRQPGSQALDLALGVLER